MAGGSSDRNRHVAVFAFPYGTHAAPLLNLVVKLARAAPHVTFSFFTTQHSKHSLLSSKFSNNTIPQSINFFTVSDSIPNGLDLTRHHPSRSLDLFLEAGPQNLKQSLNMAVSESNNMRVTCVISDAFVTSSLVIAQEYGVPWIALWTSHTCSLSAHFHSQLIREKYRLGVDDDEDESLAFINSSFSKFRTQDLPETIILKDEEDEEEESEFSKMLDSMGRILPEAEAVVVNFYEELEPPEMVQDLRSKMKSLIYAGFLNLSLPLPPPPPPANTDQTGSLRWLDQHSAKSLVYISLGTVVSPPPHELAAIADALEELEGVPFLWSLKDDSKAFLPKGFLERTSMKGKVVPWAPQTLVLAHESVGAFVTHGGCNSVSESLSCGVPMICRPYFGDQLMAARMVEDVWKVGVKIEGGSFTKNALIRSLKVVLKQEEGKMIRQKAEKLKNIVIEAASQNGKTAKEFKTLVQIIS